MDLKHNLTGPWVEELGYDRMAGAFYCSGDDSADAHPFASELRSIFDPGREVAGAAVLCIDSVPTVCLLDNRQLSKDARKRENEIKAFCERLWNQNLARVVLVTDRDSLEAYSVDNPEASSESYGAEECESARKAWSVSGLLGGDALQGRDNWFDPQKRVDRVLLDNILVLVEKLSACNVPAATARRLVARLIFITYLEDRGIVGAEYQSARRVRPLIDLVREYDREGLQELVRKLRADFNGDFLESADSEGSWDVLSDDAFDWIAAFLDRTALRSGQTSFWRYDFSEIPIELIASIYETFLASKDDGAEQSGSQRSKRMQGAYYTPRLLADWVVETAIAGRDILSESIFDGACGSGMLLTAAYRRLIRAYEARQLSKGQKPGASFGVRKKLLLEHIFGGDIDEDACQLTAFSLYLALLSDLKPRDLAALGKEGEKLPTLVHNIRRGSNGDFFGKDGEEKNRHQYGIFLSNPPWRKLNATEPAAKSLKAWRNRQPKPTPRIPKQQIAAGFALAAADTLKTDGRVALILPVTPFTSGEDAQREFRAHLLGRYRIEKIVNFSDMRKLIFADASHPFVVLIATVRDFGDRYSSIDSEVFEYWTPKTDISLAFGRLVVHGGDRATLPASSLIEDQPQLTIRYWGGEPDIALLQRLQRHGCVRQLKEQGWTEAKGFHLTDRDARRDPSTWYKPVPAWMKRARFLDARSLPKDLPIVQSSQLRPFPYDKVARIPNKKLFRGPRVLWPDGAHPEGGVKAVYAEGQFSFKHSLAVLAAPEKKSARLIARFLTAYLRSPMGLWLLLLLSGTVASERPKLHLREALDWPFWLPRDHPAPAKADEIVSRVDKLLEKVELSDELMQPHEWERLQPSINALVYEYFQLSDDEIAMIEELAELAGEALQPSSLRYNSLTKPLRRAPCERMLKNYSRVLLQTLEHWKNATGGTGKMRVGTWTGHSIPIGAAVLTLNDESVVDRFADDDVVTILADALRDISSSSTDALLTIPDVTILEENRILLVKPLISRFWMRRCAIEDGNRLALQLQAISRASRKA